MRTLRELESDAHLFVPDAIGSAIKAWKAGTAGPEQQRLAYDFVVRDLAGINRLSFALPDDMAVMGWRQGRRFVGLQIETIALEPIKEEPPPEPPARTMVAKGRRRAKMKLEKA